MFDASDPWSKRTYTLPFRASPTTRHIRLFSQSKRSRPKPLFTQIITPTDSEEEISPLFCPPQICLPPIQQASNDAPVEERNDEVDMDMDMADQHLMPSPPSFEQQDTAMLSPTSPRTLLAPQVDSLGLNEATSTGRIPTPIYGHFQQPTPENSPNSFLETSSPSTLQSDKDIEYDQYLRSRRLPSPISEDEAMDFPPPSAMTTAEQDLPQQKRLRTPARLAQPLPGQAPKPGKVMFSMGFRADCEMCRNRVPGHSNHIFRV